MIFVDTNYFLRFLLDDVSSQHKTAKALVEKGAEGEAELFTSLVVIFEIYWVFTSFYQKPKDEVVEILLDLLAMSFILIEKREIIEEAVVLFRGSSLELEDCYNLCYARSKNMSGIATFDKKLERAAG